MRRTLTSAWAAAAASRAWRTPTPTTRALASAAAPAAAQPPPSASSSWARYLLFLPPTIAAYLCHWQVDRKAWKEAQLARWEAALAADPTPLAALPPDPPELTRVTAAGTLAHGRSMLVGPRPRSVAGGTVSGFLLVTPLLEGGGGSGGGGGGGEGEGGRSHDDDHSARVVALVLRGWVPAAWASDAPGAGPLRGAPGAEPTGVVTLDPAIVRGPESPSRFVPPNAPAAGAWHWLDPPALAAAAGADGPVPLLEALAPPDTPAPPPRGGAPPPMDVLGGRTGRLGGGDGRGGGGGGDGALHPPPPPLYPSPRRLADLTTVTVSPADHRNYALTWGSLAAATAGLAVKAVRGR